MTKTANQGYFKSLLKGDIPLHTSFWVWFVFVSLLINFFIDINFEEVSLFRTPAQKFFDMFFYILTVIYSILIFLAVYRSALKYKGSKAYAFLTKIAVTIYLLFSLTTALDILRVYFFEDYAIQSEINNFKATLPIPIDSHTNLTDIDKINKDILYTYQFLKININDAPKHNYSRFKKRVQESICENENNLNLLKKDYIMKYKYIDKFGNEILNITTNKEACGKGIYDLEILKEILRQEESI